MIRKIVVSCQFSVVSVCFLLCAICYAQPINSNDLIEHAKEYDGKTIIYEGEVIGEVMARGNHAWVNINDGNNALGVWAGKDLAKEIVYAGTHQAKGDWVEAEGVFHRACPEHGGDLDIHAQSLRRINSGGPTPEKFNRSKRNQALVLLGILLLVWILRRLK